MKGIVEHEQAVLSAILKEPKLTKKVFLTLPEDRFGQGLNKKIYETMQEIFAEGKQIDTLSLIRRLKEDGAAEYVQELTSNFFARRGILDLRGLDDWIAFVDNAGRLRQAGHIFQEYSAAFSDLERLVIDVSDSNEFLSDMMTKLRLSQSSKTGFRSMAEIGAETEERIFKNLSGVATDRIATGWRAVDSVLAGGIPKGLIILCGLPGQGKTQLAVQLMYEIAKRTKKGCVAINSLEMKDWRLFQRLACAYAEIDSRELTSGNLTPESPEVTRLITKVNEIKKLPIFIDDSDMATSSSIDYQASALNSEFGPLLSLVVDYAELTKEKMGNEAATEEQRVSAVYRRGASLAKNLDMPVIVLSQYGRVVSMRDTKLGENSDIRYTGAAEAAAHSIWHIYNPYQLREMHIAVTPPTDLPLVTERGYVVVGKDKDAGAGLINLGWKPKFTKWFDPPTIDLGFKKEDEDDF